MKHPKILAGCLLTLAVAIGTDAQAVPDSGQDNRIEWNLQQNWPTAGKTLDMVHSLDGKFVYILSDKPSVQVFSSQGQLLGTIPVEDGISAIDIAPQGEMLYLINNKTQTFSAIGVSFVADIDITGSPVKGPADAPVTMVLFTDFECPYCSKIVPLLEQVLERNSQTVKLVFKNMPLKFHKMAQPSARAALAAQEQGKFWEFHDRLFAAQSTLSKETINKIALNLNLDIQKFEQDMASPKVQAQINKDLMAAEKAGVSGTPTVFINGRLLKERSPEGFQAIIDDELQKLGEKK
jgi:predicted DsbA family dithiol-disulfide isomerase